MADSNDAQSTSPIHTQGGHFDIGNLRALPVEISYLFDSQLSRLAEVHRLRGLLAWELFGPFLDISTCRQ